MENIVTAIIGAICIAIGISNRMGNISTLHSYHRNRVSAEDVLPFGKMVGLGTIIVGGALIVMSGASLLADVLNNGIYATIGTVIMAIGLTVGLGISLYAIIKYNKGLF